MLQACFTAGRDEAAFRATHDRCRAWLTEVASISRPPELDVFFRVLTPARASAKGDWKSSTLLPLRLHAPHESV